jgi:hypothetical protein
MTHCAKPLFILTLVSSVYAGCSGTAEPHVDAGVDSGSTFVSKCSDGTALPTAADSAQTVTFTLRNTSSSTRYVATAGFQCSTFAVQRVGSSDSLILDFGQIPAGWCEPSSCDQSSPVPSTVLALEPSGTYSFDWDARSYAWCETPIAECPEKTKLATALQPVAPGAYRVSVPLADSVPSDCSASGEAGRYTCTPGGLSGCGPATCQMKSSTSIEFALPESGNVQVDVPLT